MNRLTRWVCVFGCLALGAPWLASAANKPPPADPARGPKMGTDVQDIVFLAESRPVLVRLNISNNGKGFLTAWEDFVTDLFKSLDTDGDGFLSKSEAARVPAAGLLFNANGAGLFQRVGRLAGAEYAPPSLDELDSNKDGKVSREELANYYRRNGASPFQFQGGDNINLGDRFLGGQPASTQDLNETLFKLLDTNKDGKLSRQELAAAPALLLKLDSDDDEMITSQELVPGSGNGFTQFVVAAPIPVAPTVPAALWIKQAGSSGRDLAQQLLTRYGPKNQAGKTRLTRKDLGLDEKTFAHLDADGDGVLDQEELTRFAQRPADVELTVRLGKVKVGEDVLAATPMGDRPSPLTSALKKNRDGLVLDLGITRLEMATNNEAVERRAELAQREQLKAVFQNADSDNNGYIDKDEARRNPLFQGLFTVLDSKGEGKIFEKDFLAYMERLQEMRAKAAHAVVALALSDESKGLFDLIDTNRDGRLSLREMRKAVQLLDSLDRDGDGQVGRNEIPRSFQLTLSQGAGVGPLIPGRAIAIRSRVPGAQRLPELKAGPLWFRKMDRNRDGDVSRKEFLGTDEDFARIDSDGDGLISAEEADRADELFRKKKE